MVAMINDDDDDDDDDDEMIMLPPVRSYLDRSRHDGRVDQSLLSTWPRNCLPVPRRSACSLLNNNKKIIHGLMFGKLL